jgi:peptide deformylase
MTKRSIVLIGDPLLQTAAIPVDEAQIKTPAFQQLIDDMWNLMYLSKGIGLAEPQVSGFKGIKKKYNLQVAVIDVKGDQSEQWCLINPKILTRKGEALLDEGCLSVPGPVESIPRALEIEVHALDRQGKSHQIKAEGLLAHCIQHEVDHLQGRLFIDYLSKFKHGRAIQKFQKFYRKIKY